MVLVLSVKIDIHTKVMYRRIISAVLLQLTMACFFYAPCFISVTSASKAFSDDISDMLSFMQGAIGNMQDYVGDQSGCRYTCPNGSKPKPRKNHKPSFDGCGSFGFQLEKYISIKGMTKCCNEHDICYDTCDKSKETCDIEFKSCLEKMCKSIKKTVANDVYEACISTADLMYAGTVALGCKPFKDSREKACTCGSESSQNKHMEL